MDLEAWKGLGGSEKQFVMEVYLKALRGVFLMAMAAMILAAASSFVMKNNLLLDEPKEKVNSDR